MKTLRVGILGGTFDPVHVAHMHIAREVRRKFRLDEIWFLVARTPPHKRKAKITPPWHRCSMVAVATRRDPRSRLCDYELNSHSSFTIDTLRALQRKYRSRVRFYFIAGGDALRDFHKWHRFEALLRDFHIIFVQRPETGTILPDPRVAACVRPYRKSEVPWDRGSFLIDVGAPGVSSTEIRRAATPALVRKWVPPEVYQYIRKYGLYEKP